MEEHEFQIKLYSNMEQHLLYFNDELSYVMFDRDLCYFDNEKDYRIALDFLAKLRENVNR